MKKKLLSLALVLAMALTLMPTMAFATLSDFTSVAYDKDTKKVTLTAGTELGSTDGYTVTCAFTTNATESDVTGTGVALGTLSHTNGETTYVLSDVELPAAEATAKTYYLHVKVATSTDSQVLDSSSSFEVAASTPSKANTTITVTGTPAQVEGEAKIKLSFTITGTGLQSTHIGGVTAKVGSGEATAITASPTATDNTLTYTDVVVSVPEGTESGTVAVKLNATIASGAQFNAPSEVSTNVSYTAPSGGGDTKVDTTITVTGTPAQVEGQTKIKLSFTITGTGLTAADIASVTATVGDGEAAAISASPTATDNTLTYTDVEVAVPADTATGSVTVKLNATITDGKNFNAPSQATATVSNYTKPGDEDKTPLALTAANFANGTLTITMTSAEFAKAANFSVVFEAGAAGTTKSNSLQPSAFTAGDAGTYTCTLATTNYPTAAGTYTIKVTAVPTDTATYTNSTTVPAGTYEVSSTAPSAAQPVKTTYNYKTGKVTWEMPAGAAEADRFYITIYKANAVDFSSHGVAGTEAYIENYDHDGCVQVTKSGSVYSATFKPKLSNGDYVLVVENFDVYSMEGVKQLAFTISGGNSTTTVSIPSASSVKTEADVTAAVNELASMPETALTQAVVGNTAKANAYEDLDAKAKEIKGITVEVVSTGAPAFIKDNASRIEVVGAALNASENDATVKLTFTTTSAPELPSGSRYDHSSAVKFNATPTKVASPSNLKTPIVITLPRPENMIAKNIVVLHYNQGNNTGFERIYPKVSSKTITFAVTGFSNFVITEDTTIDNNDHNGSKNPSSGSSSGSSRPTNGGGSISGVTGITVIPNTPGTSSGIFTDVPSGHTFATQITWARDNNVMGGYSDGSFRPNANTNRQQLWMVLGRLAGSNPADMAAARTWAINAGISDGTNAQGAMSRQQLVTMLYRFAQSQGKTLTGSADLSSYPDSGAVASYAQEALAWAVGNGIVTGTSDGKLNPEGTASRAHFAVFLYRFSHMS